MLFYLTGLWLLAPIKSVRRLKVAQIKGKYKSISRRVADVPPLADLQGNPADDGGVKDEADDVNDYLREGGADETGVGHDGDDEEGGGESLDCATSELTDREICINTNESFHTFKNVDTKIHSCATCNCRLLKFAAAVHCHEIHTVHIDGEDEEE